MILDYLEKYQEALKIFTDQHKKENQQVIKAQFLNEEELKAINDFKQKTEEKIPDPVFILGAQSSAINEFAQWLHEQGVAVLNDRLISTGRPDILYTEQSLAVLTDADDEMVELERELYQQKAQVLLANKEAMFADCMYLNPKQASIIRKFFPQAKVIVLSREEKDMAFNQTVFGPEPIAAKDWQKAVQQVEKSGLNVVQIDCDDWLSNNTETLQILSKSFDKKLDYQAKEQKYWRRSMFEKGHWKKYPTTEEQ
jgi:hypothetical protein